MFFSRLLLNKSSSFDDFGVPGTYMSLLLLLAWLIIGLCIIRGVQSSGKVGVLLLSVYLYLYLLLGRLFHRHLSIYRSSCAHHFHRNT